MPVTNETGRLEQATQRLLEERRAQGFDTPSLSVAEQLGRVLAKRAV